MNTKSTFLAGAMLAALTATPMAQADDIKFFECKITKLVAYNHPENMKPYQWDQCNNEAGASPCNLQPLKFDFSRFTPSERTYSVLIKDEKRSWTNNDGKKMYPTDSNYPTISRTTGEFNSFVIPGDKHCSNEWKSNACTYYAYGTCELKTETTKF